MVVTQHCKVLCVTAEDCGLGALKGEGAGETGVNSHKVHRPPYGRGFYLKSNEKSLQRFLTQAEVGLVKCVC